MTNTQNTPSAQTLNKEAGCCGGPAAPGTDACCVKDAVAKAAGDAGCGCGTKPTSAPTPKSRCC